MPLLSRGEIQSGRPARREAYRDELGNSWPGFAAGKPGLFETCSNPGCRSGWLHLWRNRSAPIFEGGWTCSAGCTAARVAAAVNRELDGRGTAGGSHHHRIPLGLVLLEQGWITQSQLRRALGAQKTAGSGRLGDWLVHQGAAIEATITRALGLQWSCPVLALEYHDAATMSAAMPRLFVDAYCALPLRLAGGRVLYLGFEERPDPVLALAIERMTGLRVESGLVVGSLLRPAHARLLDAKFPGVELVEAVSEPAAAYALTRALERTRPIAARLVRVHDCLWLRMWLSPQIGPLPETGSVLDLVRSIGIQ